MKILILNGPNLNMLGIREPEIYGEKTYKDLCDFCAEICSAKGIECDIYQSNHEGDLVDKIQEAYKKYDGILINAAAYTHTSIAVPDAIKAVGIPCVEVHLSDITKREDFRKISYLSPVCIATVSGKGFEGYREGIEILEKIDD